MKNWKHVCFLSFIFLAVQAQALYSSLSYSQIDLQDLAWTQPQQEVSKGILRSYRIKSRFLKNRRDLWIYTPPSYNEDESYPLLIVFDGQAYVSDLIPTPIILDNLIAAGLIPPVIAAFVSSIDQPSRNLELPCYPPFADFLVQELLPWIKKQYSIRSNREETILAGSSYGGVAASYAALRYPQQFGKVLSQSGAFWWSPRKNSVKAWLVDQFKTASIPSIHFYLDVGDQEQEGNPSMVVVNRQMRDTLRSKGHQVYYTEFAGGHEYECWRCTLTQGLVILMGCSNAE
jgi:enterochelin esterase-like enzyme